jgi:molecular chaperone GrpE (heat shock protein)
MKKRINDAIIKERKNLTTRQKMEVENLRKQHQKEIEVIKNFILKIFIKYLSLFFFPDTSENLFRFSF